MQYCKVSIKWIDSRQIHGWVLMEDIDNTNCEVWSCGYLINESEDSYTIALSIGMNPEQACGINIIPKNSVIEFRKEE